VRTVEYVVAWFFIQRDCSKMADPQNLLIPVHADPLQYPLYRLAEPLAQKGAVKIVALGSSSTAGEGNIVPYPARLEANLRNTYKNNLIEVINLGVSGQEAPEEKARMQDVIDQKPALTIWQVGTNAVWKNENLDAVDMAIKSGLILLRNAPMDIILMDLQYAPAILTDDKIGATRRMQSIIAQAAVDAGVSVFRRFDMMRKFIDIERHSFDAIIDSTDETRLHMSDFASGRVGYELSQVITVAATIASSAAAPPSA
jgi:hypothetical protein